MSPVSGRRGPDLPYSLVAGVVPCGSKWLVACAKMAAATFAPEEPRLLGSFLEVLDERPAFAALVVNAPIGYLDSPNSGMRTCDREARELLGWRGLTVHRSPSRATLSGQSDWRLDHLDAVSATLLPRYREVAAEMWPFRQRVVYSGLPELSFYLLKNNLPLRWSKKTDDGIVERRSVLMAKIPGIKRVLDAKMPGVRDRHLCDAAALMWSARRAYGKAARRIPTDGEWDSEGLRMELIY